MPFKITITEDADRQFRSMPVREQRILEPAMRARVQAQVSSIGIEIEGQPAPNLHAAPFVLSNATPHVHSRKGTRTFSVDKCPRAFFARFPRFPRGTEPPRVIACRYWRCHFNDS